MNYIISCISHDRAENVQSMFSNFGTKEIVFFVKDDVDKKNYLNQGAKKVIISGSLMDSRNAALDFSFAHNKICIQLSDDLEKTSLNDFTGKRTKKFLTAKEVIDDILPEFINSNCDFGGFPPTNNPFFALKEYEYNKFIVGDFILVKPCSLRFDTELRLKEDYDYTLQHIKERNGTIRFGKYLNSFKHYSNKGGAVAYRNDFLEQKTIEYLINKWGDCIKLNSKRKNEILLSSKSKQIMNSPKLF